MFQEKSKMSHLETAGAYRLLGDLSVELPVNTLNK